MSETVAEAGGEGIPGGRLTHLDDHGHARLVDITAKEPTVRLAEARWSVLTIVDAPSILRELHDGVEVLEAARLAGHTGAKMTAALIPLCHSIRLDGIAVDIAVSSHRVDISAITRVVDRTGVEMEALTACAMAALTICAALRRCDPAATIEDLTLWHKSGGRSGEWNREDFVPTPE